MLSEQPTVHPSSRIEDSTLGRYTEVGERCEILSSSLDDYSYVSDNCHLMFTRVGRFCSIANNARLNPSNHPTWRATQHHFTYRSAKYGFGEDDAEFFAWRKAHAVTLGHDVWVGHGGVVLPGLSVGTGAVVAAGAVVTKDVAPYVIVAGIPARPVKERFPAFVRERLLRLAWWDWEHARLAAALQDFRNLNIYAFLEKHGQDAMD